MNDESVTPRAAGWYRDPSGGYEYGYWDGSAWRSDVSAAMQLMHENSTAKFFMRRRALARIGEFVPKDETVECIAAGTYYSWGSSPVAVVLTDRRLLLPIGGRRLARVRDDPRESVSSAKPGPASLMVIANGKRLRIDYMNPHDADDMAHAIQGRVSDRQTGPALPPRRLAKHLGKIKRWRVPDE